MVLQHFLGKEKAGGSSPPVGSQFNSTVSLHLLSGFSLPRCGKEMLFSRAFVPNLVWQAIATGITFIGVGETVGGDQLAGEAPS